MKWYRIRIMAALAVILTLAALCISSIAPVNAAQADRPLATVPANCYPITFDWDNSGSGWALEHPGVTYLYDADVSISCPDPGVHMRIIFNAGTGAHVSNVSLWEFDGLAGEASLGCSPGVAASWQAMCQQYTSWMGGDGPYAIQLNNTPDAVGCGVNIGQTLRLQYNAGTPSSPIWQDAKVETRTIVHRYCS